ncbi:hypothetical protein QE109_05245 [Fusibacter bizertensis]|uniref:Uncharacterized protein n=1 Tax=Fusibacter bizertensis TaxID=1488331 RepID=A0ABT6NAU2_9FIRM|nr:hypothetical protein [Fusibacter bizertensis]MDH8677540.1 hypothetical protein [Fusibacter bizertensis]
MMSSKTIEHVLFVSVIFFLISYLFFNNYLKIPDVAAGVVAGLYFFSLSILGLKRRRVYFTRSEPITYKTSILAKFINVLFGVFGVVIIFLTLVTK